MFVPDLSQGFTGNRDPIYCISDFKQRYQHQIGRVDQFQLFLVENIENTDFDILGGIIWVDFEQFVDLSIVVKSQVSSLKLIFAVSWDITGKKTNDINFNNFK